MHFLNSECQDLFVLFLILSCFVIPHIVWGSWVYTSLKKVYERNNKFSRLIRRFGMGCKYSKKEKTFLFERPSARIWHAVEGWIHISSLNMKIMTEFVITQPKVGQGKFFCGKCEFAPLLGIGYQCQGSRMILRCKFNYISLVYTH